MIILAVRWSRVGGIRSMRATMLPIVGGRLGFVVREVARSVIGSFTLPFAAYFPNSLASERFMQTLVKRFLSTFATMVE
jgi:hypothetical protein